jgi:hypothetical protein
MGCKSIPDGGKSRAMVSGRDSYRTSPGKSWLFVAVLLRSMTDSILDAELKYP